MNVKKQMIAMAVAAGFAASAGSVQAALILDGFGDYQAKIEDTIADATSITSTVTPITDSDYNLSRTITTMLTEAGGASSEVSALVNNGFFAHSQESGNKGWTRVDWVFDAATSFDDPLNILVDVFAIDQSADLTFTLKDGDNATASDTITVSSTGSALFGFTGSSGVDLTDIVSASLYIDGTSTAALDLTLGFIEVSEPGALALVGLGLAGLGFRKKKAAA